ncbi:hypothetical protein [Rickettsia endosymbiont of Ceutorhynchus obstrictus]
MVITSIVSYRGLTMCCTNVKEKAVSCRDLITASRKKLNKKSGYRGQATV